MPIGTDFSITASISSSSVVFVRFVIFEAYHFKTMNKIYASRKEAKIIPSAFNISMLSTIKPLCSIYYINLVNQEFSGLDLWRIEQTTASVFSAPILNTQR